MAAQLTLSTVLPTRGEMRILTALWELGEATIEEIIKHPAFSPAPNYKTTQTLLRIMEEKGLARHFKRGRKFVFVSSVTREQVNRLSVRTLLENNFAGSIADMMVGVMENGAVKESELEQLEKLIRDYRIQKSNPSE